MAQRLAEGESWSAHFNWAPLVVETASPNDVGSSAISIANVGTMVMSWDASFEITFGGSNAGFYEPKYAGSMYGEEVPAVGDNIAGGNLDYFLDRDEGALIIDLAFPVPFYGRPQSSLLLSANGLLYFNDDWTGNDYDFQLLSAAAPNGVFAPLQNDYKCLSSQLCSVSASDIKVNGTVVGFGFHYANISLYGELENATSSFDVFLHRNGTLQVAVRAYPDLYFVEPPAVGMEDFSGTIGQSLANALPFQPGTAAFSVAFVPWIAPGWTRCDSDLASG